MTDQNVPDVTDKDRRLARDWAEHIVNTPEASLPMETAAARALLAVLPPRPTLADMTWGERTACQWMQCDVKNHRLRYVIANPLDKDGEVALIDSDGGTDWVPPECVTPRPDLPRMTWPGEKPAPAPALPEGWRLADHPDFGRVVVTTENPDDDGFLAFVHRADDLHRQHAHGWCKPDALTFIDSPTTKEADQ